MIVRIVYNLDTKDVASISEATGLTAFNENVNGLLQAPHDKLIVQALAIGIQAQPIVDFFNTNNLDIDNMNERVIVLKRRVFGADLLNEFLAENVALGLTPEQSIALLQKLMSAKLMLDVGALDTARALISQVTTDEIFTEQRRSYYVDKITSFLNAV
jgi:hypothetical protein